MISYEMDCSSSVNDNCRTAQHTKMMRVKSVRLNWERTCRAYTNTCLCATAACRRHWSKKLDVNSCVCHNPDCHWASTVLSGRAWWQSAIDSASLRISLRLLTEVWLWLDSLLYTSAYHIFKFIAEVRWHMLSIHTWQVDRDRVVFADAAQTLNAHHGSSPSSENEGDSTNASAAKRSDSHLSTHASAQWWIAAETAELSFRCRRELPASAV